MNTKMIVALVVGVALVGLTGGASAAVYDLSADYTYLDHSFNGVDANTCLNAVLTGTNVGGDDFFMHSIVSNDMDVDVEDLGPTSNVLFGLMQEGGNDLTIVTGAKQNVFASSATAAQGVSYEVLGDAFEIDFEASSYTHESTHFGILPITVSATDCNWADATASVSLGDDDNGCPGCGDPEASIKDGNFGYACNSDVTVFMEDAHVLGAFAGSGITLWADANGEIWEPGGSIGVDFDDAGQLITVNWGMP